MSPDTQAPIDIARAQQAVDEAYQARRGAAERKALMLNNRMLPLAVAVLAASALAGTALGGAYAQNFRSADPSFIGVVLPDDAAADAAVTANVKSAIAASIGPGAAQINVETRVAVVTLSGEAASPAMRDRAREAAWIVSGVRDVIDRIEVKATA